MPDIIGSFAMNAHITEADAVVATRNLYEAVVPGLVAALNMLYHATVPCGAALEVHF
jgi:hypothetical protein